MKTSHVIIIVLILLAIMARNPKRTTAQITTGENAAAHLGGAVLGGLFPANTGKG